MSRPDPVLPTRTRPSSTDAKSSLGSRTAPALNSFCCFLNATLRLLTRLWLPRRANKARWSDMPDRKCPNGIFALGCHPARAGIAAGRSSARGCNAIRKAGPRKYRGNEFGIPRSLVAESNVYPSLGADGCSHNRKSDIPSAHNQDRLRLMNPRVPSGRECSSTEPQPR